jgi:hypothetical protein
MRPLHFAGRELSKKFAGKLEGLSLPPEDSTAVQELRETLLNWIELHSERKLFSREMLELN